MSVPRRRPALNMLRTKILRHAPENLNTQKRKTQKAKRIRTGTLTTIQKTVNLKYTAICEVVGKNVHATIPKGDMGYDQYHCSCRTYFCCFPLTLANICPWPLLPFFEISLKNSELKTTHNTLRDCRVHFF